MWHFVWVASHGITVTLKCLPVIQLNHYKRCKVKFKFCSHFIHLRTVKFKVKSASGLFRRFMKPKSFPHAGRHFRKSTTKGDRKHEFVPTNLHLQRIWVENESLRRAGFFDTYTHGAFTAMAHKHQPGLIKWGLGCSILQWFVLYRKSRIAIRAGISGPKFSSLRLRIRLRRKAILVPKAAFQVEFHSIFGREKNTDCMRHTVPIQVT